MALVSTVAGFYNATYDSAGATDAESLGETEDGFRLRWQFEKEPIRCDKFGDSIFDAVYRGGNCYLTLTGIQYTSLLNSEALWTYDTAFGESGVVGRSDTTTGARIAGPLVLTAGSGTTAAAAPATLTGGESIVREGTGADLQMANRLRRVPLEFRLYLYDSGSSAWAWFVTT